jgi:hypothetical protein
MLYIHFIIGPTETKESKAPISSSVRSVLCRKSQLDALKEI